MSQDKCAALPGFSDLRTLQLLDIRGAERALRAVRSSASITSLVLYGQSMDDAAVAEAANFDQLRYLVLVDTSASVETLCGLGRLVQLRGLNLCVPAGGDRLAQAVGNLKQLEGLTLECGVTDLTPLAGLVQLKGLELRGVTLRDLSPLKGMTNLKSLCLQGQVDADLSVLAALPKLQGVGLPPATVTTQRASDLRGQLGEGVLIYPADDP